MTNQPSRTLGKWRFRARRPTPTFHVLEPVQQFIHTEVTGGTVLLFAALAALALANSPFAETYHTFWETDIGLDLHVITLSGSLHHWINDGLMTLFFFNVGLEIKRELVVGELSDKRQAMVPVAGALGGMIVPAVLFVSVNIGGPGVTGWGIPMATDIAFSLGLLSLLGDRVPNEARVYLLALAVVDDLGAILAIAVFYSGTIDFGGLVAAGAAVAAVVTARTVGVKAMTVYWVLGVALWYFLESAGVHATMAGVVLALLTPVRPDFDHEDFHSIGPKLLQRFEEAHAKRSPERAESALGQIEELTRRTEAPLERLQRSMHPWSTFVVLPLFALANAGVTLGSASVGESVTQRVFIGTALGLAVGKVLGIAGSTWLATSVLGGKLPQRLTWPHIIGVGLLAGIGFTVALFITDLAFADPALIEQAKLGTMAASLVAGIGGYAILRWNAGTADSANP